MVVRATDSRGLFTEQSFTTNGQVVTNTYCRSTNFQGPPPGSDGMGGGMGGMY